MRAGAPAGAWAVLRALDAPGTEAPKLRQLIRERSGARLGDGEGFTCRECGAEVGAAAFRCTEEERRERCPYERTVRSSSDATLASMVGLALLALANLDLAVSAWIPFLKTRDGALLAARLASPAGATLVAGVLGILLNVYAWGRSTTTVRERAAGLGWRADRLFGVTRASRYTAETLERLDLRPALPLFGTCTPEAALLLAEDARVRSPESIALLALLGLVQSGRLELWPRAAADGPGRGTVLADRGGRRYVLRSGDGAGESRFALGRVGRAILRRVDALTNGPNPAHGAPLHAVMATLGATRDGVLAWAREDARDWQLGAYVEQPYRGAVFEPTPRGAEVGVSEGAELLRAYEDLLERFPALVSDIADTIARGLEDAAPPTIAPQA